MKIVSTTILIACLVIGGWWLLETYPSVRHLTDYMDNGEFLTLEARYTPEQIMQTRKQELLGNEQRSFQEAALKFHPYLLIDVKYIQDKKTREGVILWSMVDGEMVLNTDTWEKTHGFEDAIRANASRTDFKILNALAKSQGFLAKEQLQKELHLEADVIDPWIENLKQKHLITQRGDQLHLHFENPKFLVSPQTHINQWLVTKPYNHAQSTTPRYSQSQISRIAEAAFGSDFTIRTLTRVYLPIYNIEVLNPDGSIFTTEWNALNGQKIVPSYLANR
jgi:hypothetical protein